MATVNEAAAKLGRLLEATSFGREATSRELAQAAGIPDSPGQPTTRALIAEVIRTRALPVGANERGYFLVDTETELAAVLSDLEGRALAIQERARAVAWAFGVRHPRLRPIAPLEAYEDWPDSTGARGEPGGSG